MKKLKTKLPTAEWNHIQRISPASGIGSVRLWKFNREGRLNEDFRE